MNRKQLMYFMEAYRTCNIQAAADVLYISHQGLSRVLRTLEEELGQPLFRRSNPLPRASFPMSGPSWTAMTASRGSIPWRPRTDPW